MIRFRLWRRALLRPFAFLALRLAQFSEWMRK